MKTQRNHIDLLILVAILTLMVLSLGVVYSASSSWAMRKYGESSHLLGSHVLKVLLGCAMIFVFMQIDYHRFQKISKRVLLVAVALLLLTLGLGVVAKGAARWLRVGGFGLQPSELAKYALIFHLSTLMAVKQDLIKNFKVGFVPMIIWVGTVTVLVLLQPNFSTGAMIFCVSMSMLFLGRARVSHLALTLGGLVPLLLVYMVSAEYRMRRIMSFLGGSSDGGATMNYQLLQGIIGFGNGGLIGVGPGESRQRDFFLPESYGDFVFSIVGEEYGLIGTLFIMLLFLLIMLRGIRIARHARDDFGRMLASGITLSVTLYALVNAGVTLGIFPTTGLPMPFVSYGGSAMVFSSIAIGVLLNISSQTDLHPRLVQDGVRSRPVEAKPAPAAGKVY
jgi:cell division protein FtsW